MRQRVTRSANDHKKLPKTGKRASKRWTNFLDHTLVEDCPHCNPELQLLYRFEPEESNCVHTNFAMTKRVHEAPKRKYGRYGGHRYKGKSYGEKNSYRNRGYRSRVGNKANPNQSNLYRSNLYKSNSLYGSQMMKTMTADNNTFSKKFRRNLEKSGYASSSNLHSNKSGNPKVVVRRKKSKFSKNRKPSQFSKNLF